jgi:PEP-CTERM motif-containing protein
MKTIRCVLLAGVMVTAFSAWSHADSLTLTCGEPTFLGGLITFEMATPTGPSRTTRVTVPIPGSDSAAQKCAAIAQAINNDTAAISGGFNGGLASGNTITFGVIQPIGIVSDTTGEQTTWTTNFTSPGAQVQIMESPVISAPDCSLSNHLQCVAPVGETFSGAISATGHNPFTFFALGNGALTYGTLLGQINDQIATGLGIPNFCSNPNLPTLCRPLSAPFDPDTVTIEWGGTTAFDLANFGLEVAPTAVPEPSTMTLLGLGFAAIAARRRRISHSD